MAKHKKVIGFELDPDINIYLTQVAQSHGMTRLAVVERGIEAFAELMARHLVTAEKESDDDIKELFLRLARGAPMMLIGANVSTARFSDGRPGLIINDEWVFAPDNNDELMVARKDGRKGKVGRIHRGQAELLRDMELEFAPVAAIA